MEDFARIDEGLEPATGFTCPADRFQQLQQLGFGAGPGKFAQSAAKRCMAQGILRTEARHIRGEKSKRPLGILAVFGEIEMHAPDMPPATVVTREIGPEVQPAACQIGLKGNLERYP